MLEQMLNALILRLPGSEIVGHLTIIVNTKYVEFVGIEVFPEEIP
jgi:hypothetical protein